MLYYNLTFLKKLKLKRGKKEKEQPLRSALSISYGSSPSALEYRFFICLAHVLYEQVTHPDDLDRARRSIYLEIYSMLVYCGAYQHVTFDEIVGYFYYINKYL